MENKRAVFLIDQSDLSEKDKEFLKKHLEAYEFFLKTVSDESVYFQSEYKRFKELSESQGSIITMLEQEISDFKKEKHIE